MRQELIQYVELLFAGNPNAEDIKQEILQNTLDRYDDLMAQGKSPEAAYRLAISGIGDINEILGSEPQHVSHSDTYTYKDPVVEDGDNPKKRVLRAIAVALYIICAIPLLVLSEFGMDTLGLCATLSIVAVATVAILLGRKDEPDKETATAKVQYTRESSPRQELRKSIHSTIWAIGLAIYFIISFMTNAWYVTWVIFPIIGCVKGLINACLDLKEAVEYEN